MSEIQIQIQIQITNIFYYINKLPIDLVNEIEKYISYKNSIFINKQKYIINHHVIKNLIPKIKFEQYIRSIIYRDFDFVFNRILEENYLKWFEIKQYIYKNTIYKNYIYFIKFFCIENNSEKCRIILINFLDKFGLCKNQHKKNINKHIIWKI
jgi:hypothetical protein